MRVEPLCEDIKKYTELLSQIRVLTNIELVLEPLMANVNSTRASTMTSETNKFCTPSLNQLLNQITRIKLEWGNFMLWKTLALPILWGYKLEGHLSGTKPCLPCISPSLQLVLPKQKNISSSSDSMVGTTTDSKSLVWGMGHSGSASFGLVIQFNDLKGWCTTNGLWECPKPMGSHPCST